MPDPPDPPDARDFIATRSDQATSHPLADARFARYDAPEGHAYAQGGYATPSQAYVQGSPLTFPTYYSFDPYAQAAWDWTQGADWTPAPTPYEPQGELIQELRERSQLATAEFSNPLLVDPLAPPPRPRPLPLPLPQRPAAEPAMTKRKSDAERELQLAQTAADAQNPSKRRAMSRASSTASQSPAPTVLADAQPSPMASAAQRLDVAEPRRIVEAADSSGDMLPAGRVFPIQIGSALFRLSGASLSSDAPSYFSHFFAEQLRTNNGRANDIRTLYIDRDPDTFRDIALHLQGYHVVPRDGEHFVKLFADAQFYSLPRLTKQLFKSDIFISIGTTPFRIPRDSFSSPGNSPNYFSLGFAQWFSTPTEVFPGLDRNALLRPPSISPPSVPNKSGETFAELLKMLQGYELEIRNETHRANLLRDARYFHLKGLEQRLLACETSFNLKRGQNEILIRLEDIRQSGVGFLPDPSPGAGEAHQSITGGCVTYARPYTDDATANHHLVLETSSAECATLRLQPSSPTILTAQVSFRGDTLRRITALLNIAASKMGLPSAPSLSAPHLRVRTDGDTALQVDGAELDSLTPCTEPAEWVLRRGHWRVRVEPSAPLNGEESRFVAVLEAVQIEAFSREAGRNKGRRFLDLA